MESSAHKLQSSLISVVTGTCANGVALPKVLYRMAYGAVRNAGGGRIPADGADQDLVQEFLMKQLARRKAMGGAVLAREWAAMAPKAFEAYVRTSLKNLAVESNPAWNLQRALRDVVAAALVDGLPDAAGMPSSLEKEGRYVRALVARACAELVAMGTAENVKALTGALMASYGAANEVDFAKDVTACASSAARVDDLVANHAAGTAIAEKFLAEQGESGRMMLKLRVKGFKEMARKMGMALSTAHARYERVQARLKVIAEEFDGDHDAVEMAVDSLAYTS